MHQAPATPAPLLLEEKEGVWVFVKPAGYAVHPTNDPLIPDLMTWAEANGHGVMSPIHRLDRETSGLVLASPDATVRGELGACFARGEVDKHYLTLVYGDTPKRGTIARPLFDRRRRKTLEAITHYERLACYNGYSHLKVKLETGRKHQIRRHLQGENHAIVGDARYHPKRFLGVPEMPGRLWLHAHHLTLPNGWHFEAPLPDILTQHLAILEDAK